MAYDGRQPRPKGGSFFKTIVFASNIHCSSCIGHIQDIVRSSAFNGKVFQTNVSVLSGEIVVTHEPEFPVETLCNDIFEAAFEIESAITLDDNERVVSDLRFEKVEEKLLDSASDCLYTSASCAPSLRSGLPTKVFSPRVKRKHHVSLCSACQEEEKRNSKGSKAQNSVVNGARTVGEEGFLHEEILSTLHHPPEHLKHDRVKSSHPYSSIVSLSSTIAPSGEPCIPALSSKRSETTGLDELDRNHQKAQVSDIWRCEMTIQGMTCAACSSTVQDCIKRVEKVRQVNVNLMTNIAAVEFSGTESLVEKLIQEVEKVGFEVTLGKLEKATALLNDRKLSGASTLVPDSGSRPMSNVLKNIFKATFSIEGMTCAACTNSIIQNVKRLHFVKNVKVNLLSHSAEVTFEGEEHTSDITSTIENCGFECALASLSEIQSQKSSLDPNNYQQSERRIQIFVEGFFCTHCPQTLLEYINACHGSMFQVRSIPTLSRPIIEVTYVPDRQNGTTIRGLFKAIEEADPGGRFQAKVHHTPSNEHRSKLAQAREMRRLFLRLCLSFLITIPTFIIGILFTDLMPVHSVARQALMRPAWAGQVPIVQWILLLLATPVYFISANIFHSRALKEVRMLWRPGSRVPLLARFIKFGSMNLLVSAGTTIAYFSSIALLIVNATFGSRNGVPTLTASNTYFDTVVFLTFFILIGRFLEAHCKSKAGDAVGMLGKILPDSAMLVRDDNEAVQIDSDLIEIGDHLLVRHGQSPPADGILLEGEGLFDESSLTGESNTVRKSSGDCIFIGTVNVGPPVRMKVTAVDGSSMLEQIIAVVREGQSQRAPIERIADTITGFFVPIITALAVATFIVWVSLGHSGALDNKYLNNSPGGWTFWSLEFAIAVFVVACPCGIGLAAPTALFIGGGLTASHGILARGGGQAFQNAEKIHAVVFDKTGTLTEGGNLRVTELEVYGDAEAYIKTWTLIHALETCSGHPVAVAIAAEADQQLQIKGQAKGLFDSSSIQEVTGRGLTGEFSTPQGTINTRIGSPQYVAAILSEGKFPDHVQQKIKFWETQSRTVVVFASREGRSENWQTSAIFGVEDALKPSSQAAITALREKGIEVFMFTGDNRETALAIAVQVGIKSENVYARLLPNEKAEKIEWLQNNLRCQQVAHGIAPVCTEVGLDQKTEVKQKTYSDIEAQFDCTRKPSLLSRLHTKLSQVKVSKSEKALVAFVGDGINDAPALSRADISISPSSGSDIAMNCSSFILTSTSLLVVPELLNISTRVFRRVKFNFCWALFYNLILVPVAAGVFFKTKEDGFRLSPVWGSLAMALSSVSVVLSSLLLRWERPWPAWQGLRREKNKE